MIILNKTSNKDSTREAIQSRSLKTFLVKFDLKTEKRLYGLNPNKDKQGKTVVFDVYGIDKITSPIPAVNIKGISKLFKDVSEEELTRPTGEVDALIGYEYADFHPLKEQSSGHLLLLRNQFGRCVGGTHPVLKGINEKSLIGTIHAHHVKMARIEDFYNMENLGIQCMPRCGGCKCGKCSLRSAFKF